MHENVVHARLHVSCLPCLVTGDYAWDFSFCTRQAPPLRPAERSARSTALGESGNTLAGVWCCQTRPCVPVACLSAQASGTLGRKLLTKRTSRVRTLCKTKDIDDKYCTTWSLMADICSNKYGQSFPVKIVHNMRCAPRAPGLTSSFTTKA